MTKASYLQRWASHIHPKHQLPLSTKDSQKLLRLLNTEMEKELDRKHPVSATLPASQPMLHQSNRRHNSSSRLKESPYDSAAHHLGSILANPLFAWSERNRGRQLEVGKQSIGISTSQWTAKVALGIVDLDVATEYLESTLRSVNKSSSSVERAQTLRQAQAGFRVLTWLRTSGTETMNGWKADTKLCKLLTLALVAEGHGCVVLDWLSSSLAPKEHEKRSDLTWRRTLVQAYVNAHRSLEYGLDGVISSFLDCLRAHRSTAAPASLSSPQHYWPIFSGQKIGTWLVQAVLTRKPEALISEDHYNEFVASTREWRKISEALSAMFSLYHPQRPDATLISELVESDYPIHAGEMYESSHGRNSFWVAVPCLPVAACIDAAELLISQGEDDKGSKILNHVQDRISPHSMSKLLRTGSSYAESDLKGVAPDVFWAFG